MVGGASERAETAAVSRGTSHATTKESNQYTISVGINNTHYKKVTVTHSESHAACVQCQLESREWHYIKDMNTNDSVKIQKQVLPL